jgi:DNA-directed RNA polymerase specialized sigma24 family protein
MARLRWVQAMLREWAAWIEGFGCELHSPALNDLPRGNFFDSKLPKETFSLRKTQQALDRLDPEYQEILMLVYIEGPRCNKVKLSDIAKWKDVNERTFHHRVESAEAKFSQEIDFIENSSSEGE